MSTPPLNVLLSTTLELIERFSTTLQSPSNEAVQPASPSPLPLLSASASALKAQTTKLSLLAINTPFTPSAIGNVLAAVNESVLPSLVTGTLLTVPDKFAKSVSSEASTLSKATLRDFKFLVEAVDTRSRLQGDIPDDEKKSITEAVGRIWDGCDNLIALGNGGIAGLLVKKALQYQALIQDAINELEEWEPERKDDDLFSDAGSDDEQDADGDLDEEEAAELKAQKEQSLKVFRRVPQSIHVIIRSRLQKRFPPEPTTKQIQNLDRLVSSLETASEAIDEAAGALYEHDVFLAKTYTDKVKARTIDAVDCVLDPWDECSTAEIIETKDDKYIKRARDWIQTAGSEAKSS
ncbi:hypothetical protein UCRPC4_g05540 [Phaeomoniella chlamydospora]|uniref:Cyclin-D1-binding protein 1-like N-terminal domain-containing protein n=1 Tax=Phaeomoniella chlamydospora TaxID=158046 RepID=A0A0G2E434_PHACM|nr:hypothetical protein UCRPC4_g05540 [Phaeomoniella chlamydospora]